MKRSIIIPTYNRARQLDRLLCSLQPFTADEILIVDSHSTDDTEKIVNRHKLHNNLIRFLQIEEKNIPKARNQGVRASNGDILIFVDSDITIESDNWLEALISPLEDREIGISYGRMITSNRSFIERYIKANYGLGTPDYGKKSFKVKKDNFVTFPMCNTAIKKEVFKRIGEFDVGLNVGEDIDLSRRAINHFDLAYVSDALVKHHHRTTLLGLLKHAFNTGYLSHALNKKYKKSEFDNRYSPKMLAVYTLFPFFIIEGLLWLIMPLSALILASFGYLLILSKYLFRGVKDAKITEMLLYPFIDVLYFGTCSFGHWAGFWKKEERL